MVYGLYLLIGFCIYWLVFLIYIVLVIFFFIYNHRKKCKYIMHFKNGILGI